MSLCADEILAVGALTQLEEQNELMTRQIVENYDANHDDVEDVNRTVSSLLMFNQLVALSLGPVKRIVCGGECLPKNITHELITRRFVEYMVLALVNLFKKSTVVPYQDEIQPQGSTAAGGELGPADADAQATFLGNILGTYSDKSVLFRMMLFCLLQRKSVSIVDASQCECDVYKYGLGIEVALVALSLCLNMTLEGENRQYVPNVNSLRYFTGFWEFLISNKDFAGLFCDPCELCPPSHEKVEQ